MSSRYSRIFLRPAKGTTLSSESWAGSSTTADPRSTESQGFSYPPSGSSPSHETDAGPMASQPPPPHPYTLAAVHSPVLAESQRTPEHSGRGAENRADVGTEKRRDERVSQPEQRRAARQMRRASSLMPPPVPLRMRPVVLLLLFLPVPPLLAMVYMVAGHAILRHARSSPASIYRAPFVSSLEAGATGGVILAPPLALLLYILFFPTKSEDSPEDFFEDDGSSVMGAAQWLQLAGYLTALFFFFAIGGIAGPLGVTCLRNNAQAQAGEHSLLSASAAAAAGFIGGSILAFAITVGGALSISTCIRSRRL